MAGDPRTASPPPETGIRPIVARASGGASTLVIGGGVVLAGLALFLVLNGHRQAVETPAVRIGAADRAAAFDRPAPPPLYIPPAPIVMPEAIVAAAPPPPPSAPPSAPLAPPRIVYVPQPAAPVPQEPASPPPARRTGDDTALVIDMTVADGSAAGGSGQNGSSDGPPAGVAMSSTAGSATTAGPNARARAIMLANRGTTVPQGTLIPATLETAFDSTRPGLARALVSRDVRGFDGSRILIPRGSRLTGEYRSDAASGQNRALIIWTRLVRPDGATIAIASGAADTLGRGGIKAKVNTHFFARFSGAILQTALSIGTNLAARRSSDTLVLGLPGSNVGGGFGLNQNQQVTNTLTVRAGTSLSVFVSRDLDFADVEGVR